MRSQNRKAVFSGTIVLAISMCLLGCGGDDDAPVLTHEQRIGGTALCTKAASCAGVSNPSASDMNECLQMVAGALQIFPDPDAFAACVNGLSCSDMESQAKLQACADFDRTSFVCADSNTLHGCSNSGKCTSISCPDVCKLLDGSFHHCGASNDSSKAENVCWCVL